MAIDNVPAVQSLIEQTGLLERTFHTPLDAALAYSRLADDELFPNGIGETLTKTRPALYPLSQAFSPINPASNTGLDNGLTDAFYVYEQYQIAISEWALSTTVNIMQDRITRARLAGDPPDLLITPRVGQFGWFDFHRAEDQIAHGARAAERALEQVRETIDVLAPAPEGAAPKAIE